MILFKVCLCIEYMLLFHCLNIKNYTCFNKKISIKTKYCYGPCHKDSEGQIVFTGFSMIYFIPFNI